MREARRLLDPDLAQDAAQEAVVRAWRNARSCTGQPEPWIRTIARREALRILNRPVAQLLPDAGDPAAQHDPLANLDQRLDITRQVSELSPDEQLVLLLRHWADKSGEEIAALLGIPLGTVKIRIHRAHKKLARAACGA